MSFGAKSHSANAQNPEEYDFFTPVDPRKYAVEQFHCWTAL